MNKNAYFQIETEQEGTYLKCIPAQKDGASLQIDEVLGYLGMIGIDNYDLVALKQYMLEADGKKRLLLLNEKIHPVNERMIINISEDNMRAVCRIYPSSEGGSKLDEKEIITDLRCRNIKTGVQEEAIRGFLENKQYCTDYIFAKGIPPVHGTDAQITYHFNTDLSVKPTMNEDGTVDFFHLNTISHVNAGDVLATLTKEDEGKRGEDIFGTPIRPRNVKRLSLKYGKNIELSEDRCTITSLVSGHVTLVEGKVFVSDTYDVEADVDTSTGNIEYEGNVNVKGNVRSGFEIRAKGDIIVNGVVEGATLIAEGQIILKRGIQGMGRGVLEAKGNIVAKFIENATVKTEGYLNTESILHSTVSAKGEIKVNGKKGFITGGSVRSRCLLDAKTIGSIMGADTIIEVGIDPTLKERFQELRKNLVEQEEQAKKIRPVIVAFGKKLGMGEKFTPDKMKQMQMLSKTLKDLEEQIQNETAELKDIQEGMEYDANARVIVRGIIYPGVKLVISDCTMFVRETLQYCQFKREAGEVKSFSI